MSSMIEVPEPILNSLIEYLAARPWQEVNSLITGLALAKNGSKQKTKVIEPDTLSEKGEV